MSLYSQFCCRHSCLLLVSPLCPLKNELQLINDLPHVLIYLSEAHGKLSDVTIKRTPLLSVMVCSIDNSSRGGVKIAFTSPCRCKDTVR